MLCAAGYFCMARFGLLFASMHGAVSPVWPASGLAIVVVWLGGNRYLPAVAFGAFAGNLLTPVAWPAVIGIAAGATLEAWLGAWLLRRVQAWSQRLHGYTEAAGFFAAAAVAPVCSASVGVFCLQWAQAIPAGAGTGLWWMWWCGDALGTVLFGPFVQLLLDPRMRGAWAGVAWRRVAIVLGLLACFAAGLEWGPRWPAMLVCAFPVVALAAEWFGARGSRLAAPGVALVALVFAPAASGWEAGGTEHLLLLDVFLMTVGLCALALPGLREVARSRLPLWVLLGGLGLCTAVFALLQVQNEAAREARFERLRGEAQRRIERRLDACSDLLRSCAGLVEAVPRVSSAQWGAFVDTLQLSASYPEITVLGLVRPVPAGEVEDFARERRADGMSDFTVHDLDGGAARRDGDRYVISHVAPWAPNRRVLGLDWSSEPIRRLTLETAARSGRTAMSGRIALVQDARRRPGFLLAYPIAGVATAADGTAPARGWAYAGFVASEFFGAGRALASEEIALAIYHGEVRDPTALVYGTASAVPKATSALELAGQRFTLCWDEGPQSGGGESAAPAVAAASLGLVSLLLAGLVAALQATGRRATELAAERTRELQEKREQLDSLMERADCLLWDATVRIDGNDWSWSFNVHPSGLYQRLFQRRMPTLEQGLWYQLNIPEQHEMDARSRAAFLADLPGYEQEFRVIDGRKTFWLREKVSIEPIGVRHWKVAAVVTEVTQRRAAELALQATNRDLEREIAERKRAEEEAHEARTSAEEANRAKSEFLATMSHEIRTPMNSIIGFTDLLMESRLADDQREWVAIIRDSGRSLLSIINDILDLSKIEAGKVELERIPFSPNAVAREIVGLMAASARKKGVRLELSAAPNLPGHLRGDPVRFRQILLNLVSNALKFTAAGEVRILFRWQAAEALLPQGVLEVDVRDTGIGIAPDKVERLFRQFSQADGATTRKFGGTGLGLSIARRLVELMGGEIGVRSVPGQGSTFWYRVPFDLADPEPVSPLVPVEPAPAPAAGVPGARVLVADDVEFNQRLAALMLRKLGCDVEFAANGRVVLELCSKQRYDVVFMDCQMPEMDGFEATREIRRGEAGSGSRRVPIVAMTANAVVGDRERCLEAGMDDYVAKPLEMDDLRRVVSRWAAAGTPPLA